MGEVNANWLPPFYFNVMTFSKFIEQYGPWSLSKLEVARNCGHRFWLKYVEKKKEQVAIRPEGRVGAAAHKAIELVLKGEIPKRAFTVAAVDNKLTTNEIDDLMTFQETIDGFLKRIDKFKSTRPVNKQFVEFQFGLSKDLKQTTFFAKDVFIRGVWDYGLHLQSDDLILIDHKSGQPSTEIDKHKDQLNFYSLAGRIMYPTIRGVQSALHYLRNGSIVWGKYTSVKEIDKELVQWFIDYLNSTGAGFVKEPRPGWYCNYCGYPSCPLHPGKK